MPVARPLRVALFAGFLVAFSGIANGQSLPLSVPFAVDGVTYDANVPSLPSILGHRVGDRHTRPHQIVEYFQAVAAASDRVSFVEYGRSYENRPLIAAIVSSPGNHARLDQIREANLRLTDDPASVGDADLDDMPAIVELHYTVHGNEASGSEAALLLLYHLAAGQGQAVESLLEHAVVLIDPVINPDGRDRFVDWVNENRTPFGNPDPQDREHNEPWPNGRTNHYWFDLNRDWLPAQLPETQARLELFHSWRPQVLLDGHEMGADESFFFQPGIPARTNPNTPAASRDLTDRLTRYTARSLDRIGSLYFTREQFDDFYYGKGSTYPDVNGAIGILFEQASSRSLVTSSLDGELTFGFGIRNQLAASIGLIEGAVGLRKELLGNQLQFYQTAREESKDLPTRAWVFGSEADRTQSDILVQTLLRHRIEVYELAQRTTAGGHQFLPGNAYVVPTAQQQSRLAKTVFESVDTFQDSVFYDVSTWTFPLAFGISYGAVTDDVSSLLGGRIQEHMSSGGHLIGGKSDYGYVMGWNRYYAPRALYRLLAAGVPARLVLQPFELTIAGKRVVFDRGTIVIPAHARSPGADVSIDSLHGMMMEAVLNDHVVIHSIGRSLTPVGPDLGGPSTVPLHLPMVATLLGKGVSSYRVGELRHLLNERMQMPLSLLDVGRLDQISLTRYTTIVMVDGDYSGLTTDFVEKLKQWVHDGGRLVSIQRAAKWAVENGLAVAEFEEKEEPSNSKWIRFENREIVRQVSKISGAIMSVHLDASHPIAFGLGQRIASFKTTETVLKPTIDPGTTVGVYTRDPLLSGYMPRESKTAFDTSANVLSLTDGDGRVVLMQDSPTFRGFWFGTQRLLLNAALLSEAY